MSQIKSLQESIHAWAIRKEWRGPRATPRPFVADLMLFVSEIAEALEELRKHPDPLHSYFSWTAMVEGVKFPNLNVEQLTALQEVIPDLIVAGSGKPEGVAAELADLAIRLFETCEEYGIDLTENIERKMAYNEGRPVRHGGLLM